MEHIAFQLFTASGSKKGAAVNKYFRPFIGEEQRSYIFRESVRFNGIANLGNPANCLFKVFFAPKPANLERFVFEEQFRLRSESSCIRSAALL